MTDNKIDTEFDYVCAVDCLPEAEYISFQITQNLKSFLSTKRIECKDYRCVNSSDLYATFEILISKSQAGEKFILHFVSHGTEDGLWLKAKSETVLWKNLSDRLEKINNRMGKSLVLNMSSCFGLYGIKIVDKLSSTHPFFGLIGYNGALEVPKAIILNRIFYNYLSLNEPIERAVANTIHDLSDANFHCISSRGFQELSNAT